MIYCGICGEAIKKQQQHVRLQRLFISVNVKSLGSVSISYDNLGNTTVIIH